MLTDRADFRTYDPSAHLAVRGKYRFDPFELDTLKGVLYRDGVEVHLRHKTFQVLRHLIEHRERIVTKQELWDHLWNDSAVTDDALVQCVKDIRRALADDPREPKYVRTLPRLGYRFVATIQDDEDTPDAPVELEDAPGAEGVITPALPIVEAPRKSALRRGVPYAAAAALLLAIVGSVAISLRGTRGAALPADPTKTSVVVTYLDNESGMAELDWLRQGLADMLISGLSRSDHLTLVGRQQLDTLLARQGGKSAPKLDLERARKLAAGMRAEKVVLGTFGRLGSRLRVDVQLYDTATGHLVGSERLIADREEQILSEIDLLSLRLAARLGTPRPPGRLADVMTDNLEAYRYYSLAVEQAHALRTKEAIALLQRAVDLDPRFAMAHARIGYTYGVVWGAAEQAKPHLEKAFSQPDRLTPRDRLNITAWYALASFDFAQATRLYRQIVKAYPYDVEAYARLGRLLEGEERFDEAIEVLTQAMTVDRDAPDIYNQLASAYNAKRMHDRALEFAQRYVETSRGEANAYDTLGLTYSGMGDYASARVQFERALSIRPDFEVARVHLANTYAREGRLAAADAELRRYLDFAATDGDRQRGWGYRAYVARLRGRDRERSAHVAQLENVPASLHFEQILLALERRNMRVVARAREEGKQEMPNRGGRLTRRFHQYTRGMIALKMGQPEAALQAMRASLAHPSPIWAIDDMETGLAETCLELGRYDEAIGEYARVIKLLPNHGLAHYGLAQAYDRSGRRGEALAAYRGFLHVWREADADLPSVVTARRRVKELEASHVTR